MLFGNSLVMPFLLQNRGYASKAANDHYTRVIADGGTIDSYDDLVDAIQGLADTYLTANLSTFLAAAIDPAIFGYKYRTDANGRTWCAKAYSLMGASSDVEQGTESAQPILLRYEGVKYGFLPGIAANSFSTPDAASLDITGDIALAIDLELKSAMTSGAHTLGGKANGAGQISYYLGVDTGGFATLTVSLDGTALTSYVSDVAAYSASGRLSIAAERNSTTGDVTFYTGSALSGWTQLGSVIAGASGAIFASTATLVVGGLESGVNTNALKYYGFQVYSGDLTGTLAAYFQPSLYDVSASQTTLTDSTTKVWTANRSAVTTGYKTSFVYRTIAQGDGIDDVLANSTNVPYSAAYTHYMVSDLITWLGSLNGATGIRPGWTVTGVSPNIAYFADATSINTAGEALSRLQNRVAVVDGASSLTETNNANQTTGTLTNNADALFAIYGGKFSSFSNSVINTFIMAKQADDATTRTAIYNLTRGWSGNPA